MTHIEFALKYPEVVRQVQNKVFPCSYDGQRAKDAKHLVELIIEKGETPIIDVFAVNDSLSLYDIDNELFEDYKDFKTDWNILLKTVSKQKHNKKTD